MVVPTIFVVLFQFVFRYIFHIIYYTLVPLTRHAAHTIQIHPHQVLNPGFRILRFPSLRLGPLQFSFLFSLGKALSYFINSF